jgi:hypothetical protein
MARRDAGLPLADGATYTGYAETWFFNPRSNRLTPMRPEVAMTSAVWRYPTESQLCEAGRQVEKSDLLLILL